MCSISMPMSATMSGAITSANQKLPVSFTSRYPKYAPSAYRTPWVKLSTFIMPKIIVSPSDTST